MVIQQGFRSVEGLLQWLPEAMRLANQVKAAETWPEAVLRFSPVVVYSYLQVFSPARVATWRALEVPWGHVSPLAIMSEIERDRFRHS